MRLLTTRAPKGMGGTPSDRIGRGAWGVRGEEKWKQDGTGTPEGQLGEGEGKGSHSQRGMVGGTIGRAEDQKGVWPGFPCPLGPPGTC